MILKNLKKIVFSLSLSDKKTYLKNSNYHTFLFVLCRSSSPIHLKYFKSGLGFN